MQLSRALQAFLFHDVWSYFMPGILTLIPVALFDVFPGSSAQVKQSIQTLGAFPSAIAFLVSAYIAGYLVSTVSFISWEFWATKYPPINLVGTSGLVSALRNNFGDIVEKRPSESDRRHSNRLVDCCLEYIEANHLEFFAVNIERKLSMKNFEVGLSGALLAWVGSFLVSIDFPSSLLPAGLTLGLALYLHFKGSRDLDRLIEERAVAKFMYHQAVRANCTAGERGASAAQESAAGGAPQESDAGAS